MEGSGFGMLVLRWGVFEWGEIVVEEVVCTARLCELVHDGGSAAVHTQSNTVVRKAMD